MDKEEIVTVLNNALAHEYACRSRYLTHAAMAAGPHAEIVADRLMEMAEDEERHASKLRHRITALGGNPTRETTPGDRVSAKAPREMFEADLEEERKAIDLYYSLLALAQEEKDDLFDVIEEILEEEEEHMKDLERLRE